MLLNVRNQKWLLVGKLSLSPASTLTWLGFTEVGSLSSYDSQGVLRVYSNEYDGCWIPVFSAAAKRKKGNNDYWVVGLNTTKVYCVVCKAPDTQPHVLPKPVMSVINTAVPVMSVINTQMWEQMILKVISYEEHYILRTHDAGLMKQLQQGMMTMRP